MPGDGPGLQWITASNEIRSVRKSGKLYRGDHVFVWVLDSASEAGEPAAVAVVTGRGFSGAVARNLAKRRIKGSLFEKRELLKPGSRYLIEGRAGVEEADYQLLVTEIDSILSRARNCVKKRKPGHGDE
jgi:ribonuclease P protein component